MNNPLSNCCGRPPIGEIHNNFAYCSDCKEMAEFSDHDEEPELPSVRRSFEEWWKWEGMYLCASGQYDAKGIAEYSWMSAIKNVIKPQ